MPRIRSLHPGQWTDEHFVALTYPARLLALAVRNVADDLGIFEWKPPLLKMQLFPADNIDVAPLLEELRENTIVMKFEVNGKPYGAIRNFTRWQRPKKPSYAHPTTDAVLQFVGAGAKQSCTGVEHEGLDDEPVPNHSFTGSENPSQRKEEGGNGSSSSEPDGSGSPPVSTSPETHLFKRGKEVLGRSAGGVISQLKKRCGGDAAQAFGLIEQSAAKENPMEWVQGVLRATDPEEMAYRNMV